LDPSAWLTPGSSAIVSCVRPRYTNWKVHLPAIIAKARKDQHAFAETDRLSEGGRFTRRLAPDRLDDREVPQAVSEVFVARGGILLGAILIADGVRGAGGDA
jgi:hypothetical protein